MNIYMSSFLFIKKHVFFPFILLLLLLFFNFLGRGAGNTLYLFMLYYIVVRSTAHFFRFSNNLNCVEEIIKKIKKNLTQCTKLLLLRGLGKVMANNFIYFKHIEQSNISFYKKIYLLNQTFLQYCFDFKCFIIASLEQKQ